MKRDLYVGAVVSGFLLAIFASSFVYIGASRALLLLLLSISIFLFVRYALFDPLYSVRTCIIACFLLGAGFGVLRYELADTYSYSVLAEHVDMPITLEGICHVYI